ncbi:TerC family protein [Ammoniphilus sp. CFH 90114]|nr:TerC family protein [Ammoniphilus sp. CFH 90114]RXT09140.1 TerC family protein [Ammoniphilus sp. CFH 90114]
MALLTIIAIDLVLAGDNAVVIALASRNLPLEQRNKAILWGTFGAVIIRIILTLVAVWLMKVPLLQAIGGLLLIYVAIKLMKNEEETEGIVAGMTLRQAVQTIIVADLIMGLDNVLAIAGAAHGNMVLVVLGLAISVPIVVWGSKWISSLMNRFPIIVTVGAGILAYTAGTMVMHDKLVNSYITFPGASWIVPIVTVVLVISIGTLLNKKAKTTIQHDQNNPKAV